MRRQMRQFGMQFPTELLDEFPDRFSYVGHQGITRTRHDRREIIPRPGAYAGERPGNRASSGLRSPTPPRAGESGGPFSNLFARTMQ